MLESYSPGLWTRMRCRVPTVRSWVVEFETASFLLDWNDFYIVDMLIAGETAHAWGQKVCVEFSVFSTQFCC